MAQQKHVTIKGARKIFCWISARTLKEAYQMQSNRLKTIFYRLKSVKILALDGITLAYDQIETVTQISMIRKHWGVRIIECARKLLGPKLPYRAELCLAKFSFGETIRHQSKNLSLSPRRKISPNKSKNILKWSTSEPTEETSHFDKFWLSCWVKLCRAKSLVGRNHSSGEIFITFKKIHYFRPTKFHPILRDLTVYIFELDSNEIDSIVN